MGNYKNIQKRKLIESIVVMGLLICCGIFFAVVTFLGVLEHFEIIHDTWEITNFSWIGLFVSCVIIFCFVYFPIKSIIGRIRKYKRIAKLADDVADEYEQSFKPPQESNERQEEQTKVTLSEEEMKQMNYKAPTFAKRNRGFYVVLHFVGIAIIEAAGIGMLLHPEGNNMYGWICVGAGVVYLIACSIYFLTEFKGKEVYGKLLSIERRKLYHGYREYVLVAYKGKVKNLSLPFDSVNNNQWDYNDGMALLKSHIGKEIPLRVLCGNIIIDWKKLYWKAKSNSR